MNDGNEPENKFELLGNKFDVYPGSDKDWNLGDATMDDEVTEEISGTEHENQEPIYEKVMAAPVYGVDASGEEYNILANEFLIKGYWRRVKDYRPPEESGVLVNTTSPDSVPPVLVGRMQKQDLQAITPQTSEDFIEQRDALDGMGTEGQDLKLQDFGETDLSMAQAADMFELSKRDNFETAQLAELTRGLPAIQENMSAVVAAGEEIARMINDDESSAEEIIAGCDNGLATIQEVRRKMATVDVPTQLAGAIFSKLEKLEAQFSLAREKLARMERDEETAGTMEKLAEIAEETAEDAEELGELAG